MQAHFRGLLCEQQHRESDAAIIAVLAFKKGMPSSITSLDREMNAVPGINFDTRRGQMRRVNVRIFGRNDSARA